MKKTIEEDIVVVVEPKIWGRYNPEQVRRDAEEIIAQIKRHVDGVGYCQIESKKREVCSFCGYDWEENDDPDDPDWEVGMPVCCEKAQEEWRKEQP